MIDTQGGGGCIVKGDAGKSGGEWESGGECQSRIARQSRFARKSRSGGREAEAVGVLYRSLKGVCLRR